MGRALSTISMHFGIFSELVSKLQGPKWCHCPSMHVQWVGSWFIIGVFITFLYCGQDIAYSTTLVLFKVNHRPSSHMIIFFTGRRNLPALQVLLSVLIHVCVVAAIERGPHWLVLEQAHRFDILPIRIQSASEPQSQKITHIPPVRLTLPSSVVNR